MYCVYSVETASGFLEPHSHSCERAQRASRHFFRRVCSSEGPTTPPGQRDTWASRGGASKGRGGGERVTWQQVCPSWNQDSDPGLPQITLTHTQNAHADDRIERTASVHPPFDFYIYIYIYISPSHAHRTLSPRWGGGERGQGQGDGTDGLGQRGTTAEGEGSAARQAQGRDCEGERGANE